MEKRSLFERLTCRVSKKETAPDGLFECNICLDTASEPVVTFCGHLYCWPCIHQWLISASPQADTCPTCKSGLSKDNLIPIYVKGREAVDPRTKTEGIPERPSAQRSDPDQQGPWWLPRSFARSYRQAFRQVNNANTSFSIHISPFGLVFTSMNQQMQDAFAQEQIQIVQQISNMFSLFAFILFMFFILY